MKNLLSALFVCFLAFPVHGQLNLKVGYLANFISPDNMNRLFGQFDQERPWLEKRFGNIKFINGIKIGLGQRIEDFEVDFTYKARFRSVRATGTDPSDDSSFERKVSVRLNSFSLGAQYHIGMISFGTELDREKFLLKYGESAGADLKDISEENGWSSEFFIAVNTDKSNGMSFTLRPFAKVYWTDFDIGALADSLDVSATAAQRKQNLFHFGIALVFNNGK